MDKGNEFDLNELLKIQQGVAKGQWTGRIERDGIMDQFMDFNLSNLVLDWYGTDPECTSGYIICHPTLANLG